MTYMIRAYADYLGTDHQLALCGANNVVWRDRACPVWGAAGRNVVELAEAAYTAKALLEAIQMFALLAKPGDWLVIIHMGHGTDEIPLLGPMGDVEGRAQGIIPNDFDWENPATYLTAAVIEAALAGCQANVAIIIDGCTCGGFVRDTVDKSTLYGIRRAARTVRYLPNPAWVGQRAFRDLPVVNMCPEGERICVLTACAEGESAPDIDEGGFSDIATVLLAGEPTFPWSASLLADAIGGRLDPAIGNHPQASGPIADTAWPHLE